MRSIYFKLLSMFQEKGTACLHVACRAGQPAQAELLVAWGADPNTRDSAGNTPADCARYIVNSICRTSNRIKVREGSRSPPVGCHGP